MHRPVLPRRLLAVFCAVALTACAVPGGDAGPAAPRERFSFGLWGDMPYRKAGDHAKMPALLDSINASDIAFSIYDGDIKDGSSRCTDDTFSDALAMFNRLKQPVVYVPGDNEWTDCHRLNNGSMDPLERLAYLRRVMFATPDSLGQRTLALQHQGQAGQKFVENTRFERGGVVFVGINMPGSNNNRIDDARQCSLFSARTGAQCDAANAEYRERDAANVDWLKASFAQARAQQAVGLVLVVQADPGFDLPETGALDESTLPEYSGYRHFMRQLAGQTRQFSGQVLFVHGDTHFFKLDKPLNSPSDLLPNFTRLQTFGSPSIHWVRVRVDPASANVFQVEPVLVRQPG